MRFSTLRRHLRESLKNIGRNGWMTFASISAVSITLLIVGVFLIIMFNLNSFANELEKDVQISVYIDVTANQAQKAELETRIQAIPEVGSVTYSTKKQELEKLKKSFGENGKAFGLIEQSNPLSDVYYVKTKMPTDTGKVGEQIEKFNYVTKAEYGKGKIEKLFTVLSISRNVGLGLIIGLLFTAMFLISNTIKITIFARGQEIEIMKLVGATNGFIRWPFFLEGLWLGILGSTIPIGLLWGSYPYLYHFVQSQTKALAFIHLLPPSPFIWQVSAVLIGTGSFIGVWGSLVSVRKFLKV